MGKNFWTPFKVGLVVLAGIVVTIFMVTSVTQDFSDGEGTYTAYALFDDATGLNEKSQVRVAGIVVGEVASIELVNGKAKVTLKLSDKVTLFRGFKPGELKIKGPGGGGDKYEHGATLSKKLSSLLGDYYLELNPGSKMEGNPAIKDGGQIYNVAKSGGTEAIFKNLEKITNDISKLSNTLAGEEGIAQIENTIANVEETTAAIRELIAGNTVKINNIVTNVDNAVTKFDNIAKNIDEVAQDSKRTVNVIGREVRLAVGDIRDILRRVKVTVNHTGQRLDLTMDKVDEALNAGIASVESVQRSVSHVEEITKHINDGKGTAGRLLKDDRLADETEGLMTDSRALVSDTRELVQHVDHTVSQLDDVLGTVGRLEIEVDWRNDYMWNFESFKNVVAFKLKPSPNKWYQIELIRDPRGSTSTVRRVVDSTGGQPTYEQVTETSSDFKFSVQYAGRFPAFPGYFEMAGRFGVIENAGGIGGNLYFFDDKLEVVTDLYDFGFSENPRWRWIGILYADLIIPVSWLQYVYFSGGADDLLNDGTRDYFFGGGLSFTDRDLKGILPFAPSP